MSDAARATVLARVRSALSGATRTPLEGVARDYATERPTADVVGLFCDRVADYRATVERVPSEVLAGAIAAALRGVPARRVVTPDGLPQAWCDALGAEFELVGGDPDVAELDRVDAVVTTAVVGIASTGTIVLDHGPGQGRRAAT